MATPALGTFQQATAATMPMIALAGNPNTGKSTLFNRLTGLHQRVGNYPGVTVERKCGRMQLAGRNIELVDLPGTYSLAAASPDEQVVADALTGRLPDMRSPDLVVYVADAGNLQRHLFLACQIADLGLPMVIAANLVDAAMDEGIRIDTALLSERLGVPVIPTVATTGQGLPDLHDAMAKALDAPPRLCGCDWPDAVTTATHELRHAVRLLGGAELSEGETRRLLFDARSYAAERLPWAPEVRHEALAKARTHVEQAGLHPLAAESILTHQHLRERLHEAVTREETGREGLAARVDRILLHRVWGLAIFLAVMGLVFQAIYTWAGPLMELIEAATGWLQALAGGWLVSWPLVQDLVVTGVIGGIGGVLVFLPQICILFLFIAILEDSGYMARAAFLMDRLFSWCGLNGKSFIPMLSSYACAVPGIMATRTIDHPKARLTTLLTAPLMSCSARLPVYVLLIGAFVAPLYGPFWAGVALFAMHLLGLAVAMPTAWAINRFLLRTPPQPFLLEMPPYRRPVARDVLFRVAERARVFVTRAGTVILAMSVIIWALLYFPHTVSVTESTTRQVIAEQADAQNLSVPETERLLTADPATSEAAAEFQETLDHRLAGAHLENSYLARAGKAIQPIFAPAGYDWKITVGVMASFPAREVIIATLGIISNLGGDVDQASGDLRAALATSTWQEGPRAGQPVFNIAVAFSIMVFFALCLQCGATVATMAKESNWRWAIFAFVWMTTLAWLGAVITYQLGSRLL